MVKKYNYNYNDDAFVVFEVDDDKFTEDIAKECLDFFIWDYDDWGNPVEELLKNYAIEIIKLNCGNSSLSVHGIIREMGEMEGFVPLDGSIGLKLITSSRLEIYRGNIELNIT